MSDLDSTRIDKNSVAVTPLSGPPNDREYWFSKSPYERLRAVEVLREINYGRRECTARLQRVFEVAQRTSG
jgi:hypothetical protein